MNSSSNSVSKLLNSNIISTACVERANLEQFIIRNKSLLKKHELSWTREIIRALNLISDRNGKVDTVKFMNLVKAKKRRSHRMQCSWYLKVFKSLGASYSRDYLKFGFILFFSFDLFT